MAQGRKQIPVLHWTGRISTLVGFKMRAGNKQDRVRKQSGSGCVVWVAILNLGVGSLGKHAVSYSASAGWKRGYLTKYKHREINEWR